MFGCGIDKLEHMFYTYDCQELLKAKKTFPQTVLQHHRTGLLTECAYLYFTYFIDHSQAISSDSA